MMPEKSAGGRQEPRRMRLKRHRPRVLARRRPSDLCVSAQAQAEVDTVLGGRESVTVEDYKALRYTMRCINESMRLYPHPPVLLRRANVPDQLPGDPAATYVMLQGPGSEGPHKGRFPSQRPAHDT